jgi:transcriptional regulator with XRE-family HTH domain
MNELLNNDFSIQSYIDDNREKIDESLVSLRLMKEIDNFLDDCKINQREFANEIGCSEAYISQLMSGTKRINTSFINKFEKKFDVEISFEIKSKKSKNFFSEISGSSIKISVNIFTVISTESGSGYSFENNYKDFFSVESNQLFNLKK